MPLSANNRRNAPRRGAAAVEFALVAPILVMVIVAVIEFSRLSMVHHAADNAAYEAARHVIVPGATVAEAIAASQPLLDAVGIHTSTITVDPMPITESTPAVTVRVEIPMSQNAWIVPFYTANTVVEAESTLITERPPGVQALAIPGGPTP